TMIGADDVWKAVVVEVGQPKVVGAGGSDNLLAPVQGISFVPVDAHATPRRLLHFRHDDVQSAVVIHVCNFERMDMVHVGINDVSHPLAIYGIEGSLVP